MAGGAAAAANAGAGGVRTPGTAQFSDLNEDSASEEEEEDAGAGAGVGSDLGGGKGAGNEAGFAISRDYPCGECQVIFLAQ